MCIRDRFGDVGFRDPEIVMDPYNIYAVVMMRGR